MYNAFISYSHAADGKLAPALQSALEKFAKPWYKLRNLNVFRDETSLSVSPHLWSNITTALDKSEYLIYLASPKSAKSKWVTMEIEYWLKHKSLDTLLIALTDGDISWDNHKGTFHDISNNSLPDVLDNVFKSEPFYIDLRTSKTQNDISLGNPIFKKEVLKLAAQLHNKEPKDLASDEVKGHRKILFIRNSSITLLVLLLAISVFKTFEANRRSNDVQANLLMFQAQFERNPNKSLDYTKEALKLSSNARMRDAAFQEYSNKGPLHQIIPLNGKVKNYGTIAFLEGDSLIITKDKLESKIWNLKGELMLHGENPDDLKGWPEIIYGNEADPLFIVNYNIGEFDILHAKDSSLVKKIYPQTNSGNYKTCFVSSDNKKIVSTWTDGSVKVWDILSGYEWSFQTGLNNIHKYCDDIGGFLSISAHNSSCPTKFDAVAISADGKQLVLESANPEFLLWDLSEYGLENSIEIVSDDKNLSTGFKDSGDIENIFLSPTGSSVIITGTDDDFYEWEYLTDTITKGSGSIPVPLTTTMQAFSNLNLFSNDDFNFNNGKIYRRDHIKGKRDTLISELGDIKSFQITQNEQYIVIEEIEQSVVTIYKLESSESGQDLYKSLVAIPIEDKKSHLPVFNFSDDGDMMMSCILSTKSPITAYFSLWDLEVGSPLTKFNINTDYNEISGFDKFDFVPLFFFAPDGSKVIIYMKGKLMVWNTPTKSFQDVFSNTNFNLKK